MAIDPTFNINRVVYSIEDFLELVKVLPPGSAVVADEIGEWFSARNFMKEENKDLSAILQVFRLNRLAVIYTLPAMFQVDKNLRFMSDVYIRALKVHRDKDLGEAKYYDIKIDSIRGKKPITPHPKIRGPDGNLKKITRVFFDRIPKKLEIQYMKKKEEFNQKVIAEKLRQSEKRREKEEGEKKPNEVCPKCNHHWYFAGKSIFRTCKKCGTTYKRRSIRSA